MVQPGIGADREERSERARFRIVAPVDDPRDARVDESPGAHRARLERRVECRSVQAPSTEARGRSTKRAKQIAAATVNKQRRKAGQTKGSRKRKTGKKR